MKATKKHWCVPAHTTHLEWTDTAVKELAGSECVYVQLFHDEQCTSDFAEFVATCDSQDINIVKIETPAIIRMTSRYCLSGQTHCRNQPTYQYTIFHICTKDIIVNSTKHKVFYRNLCSSQLNSEVGKEAT